MPHKNPGYDIESRDASGNVVRCIEVKSFSGRWNNTHAVLSRPQFNKAHELGNVFWLYVVERAKSEDFQIHRIQAGWRNKLIWGDNLLVMGSLLEKFAGKIDLIYIDPPFARGADFSFRTQIGEQEVTREATLLEEKAYRDTWCRGIESFVHMLLDRFRLMRPLLSDRGTIYVHMG